MTKKTQIPSEILRELFLVVEKMGSSVDKKFFRSLLRGQKKIHPYLKYFFKFEWEIVSLKRNWVKIQKKILEIRRSNYLKNLDKILKEKPILKNEPKGKIDKYLSQEWLPAKRNNSDLSLAENTIRKDKSSKKIPNYKDYLNPNFYDWHKGLRYEKLAW